MSEGLEASHPEPTDLALLREDLRFARGPRRTGAAHPYRHGRPDQPAESIRPAQPDGSPAWTRPGWVLDVLVRHGRVMPLSDQALALAQDPPECLWLMSQGYELPERTSDHLLGLRASLTEAGVREPYHADIYGFAAQIGHERAREGVRRRTDEDHWSAASAMAGD